MNEPAFPSFNYITQDGRENPQGMTLRDYFAAKAMQAFIHGFAHREEDNIVIPNNISQHSYVMADLMMEARK
jgi:hypothetical protein